MEDMLRLEQILREMAPVDTGNLRDNGIGGAQAISCGWEIVIGGPAAPYAPRIKNKGKPGLNDWAYKACARWSQEMARKYGGATE